MFVLWFVFVLFVSVFVVVFVCFLGCLGCDCVGVSLQLCVSGVCLFVIVCDCLCLFVIRV